MTRRCYPTKLLGYAMLSIVLLLALGSPAGLAAEPSSIEVDPTSTEGDGPCVKVSTDPPNVGVYKDCSGHGYVLPFTGSSR